MAAGFRATLSRPASAGSVSFPAPATIENTVEVAFSWVDYATAQQLTVVVALGDPESCSQLERNVQQQ